MGNISPSQQSQAVKNSTVEPPAPQFLLPNLLEGESSLLSKDDIDFLNRALPGVEYQQNWTLLYNSNKDGKSFNRFCFHCQAEGPSLIIIRETGGHIFGGFLDTLKDKYPKYYGNGSTSFVFQIKPKRQIWRPTGYNENYQYFNFQSTALFNGIGQGGQIDFFTWCIDESFDTGHCRGNPSSTFGNPPLSSSENFQVDVVEVWKVKEPEYSYELEKLRKKKNKTKSVLEDDGNPDKVLVKMMGHNFTEEPVKEKHEEPPNQNVIPSMFGNSFNNTNNLDFKQK